MVGGDGGQAGFKRNGFMIKMGVETTSKFSASIIVTEFFSQSAKLHKNINKYLTYLSPPYLSSDSLKLVVSPPTCCFILWPEDETPARSVWADLEPLGNRRGEDMFRYNKAIFINGK